MLHRPTSRAALACATCWLLFAGPSMVRAQVIYETGYLPTSSILALPTSSVYTTSYAFPTAYSGTYLPTASILSSGDVLSTTSYVPTYRTTRFRPRRYVERTRYLTSPSYSIEPTSYIVPSSYLLPTSYVVPTPYSSTSYLAPTSYLLDTGLVTTSASSICCESAPSAPARTSTTRPSAPSTGVGNTITSEPATPNGSANERRPSVTIDDGTPSNVTPPVPAQPQAPAAGLKSTPRGGNTLPEPGPIDPGTPPTPVSPSAPAGAGNEIQIPAPGQAGAPPQANETSFHKSQRPTYEVRNILRGKVVSYDSGRPEEGVTVILSSRTQSFTDRPAMTDADGEFKVSLPDGDWTVKVRMSSGTVYRVGRDYLTASSGRIVDAAGRSVKEFLITR